MQWVNGPANSQTRSLALVYRGGGCPRGWLGSLDTQRERVLFPGPTSARRITRPVNYGVLGWLGQRRWAAVAIPADVESAVDDRVDVV